MRQSRSRRSTENKHDRSSCATDRSAASEIKIRFQASAEADGIQPEVARPGVGSSRRVFLMRPSQAPSLNHSSALELGKEVSSGMFFYCTEPYRVLKKDSLCSA